MLAGGRRLVTMVHRQSSNRVPIMLPTNDDLRDARAVIFNWHSGMPSSDRAHCLSTERVNENKNDIRLDRQGLHLTFI